MNVGFIFAMQSPLGVSSEGGSDFCRHKGCAFQVYCSLLNDFSHLLSLVAVLPFDISDSSSGSSDQF